MAILSGTETPPSPAGSGDVGPKAKALIAAINQVGIKSLDGDRAAKTITANNAVSFFPAVYSTITGVAANLFDCMKLLSGMSPEFSAAEQNEIYHAFKGFTQIHGQFIASVVGNHNVVAQHDTVAPFPCCKFTAICFLADKTAIDTFALSVTALMPTRIDDAKSQQESLDRNLTQVIDLFGP